jgi:DNA-binding NarL/FixJ family response regulator
MALKMDVTRDLQSVLHDPARLNQLSALRLLDTPEEEQFDRLTRMATKALGTPIALISLVDQRRQFFKSACGLSEPWSSRRETPLTHSFCKHVVGRARALVVQDARVHPLVCENAAVTELGIIAYLGIPLAMRGGLTFGSYCVVDLEPRPWTAADRQTMVDLAALVISEIALRSTNAKAESMRSAMVRQQAMLHAARQLSQLSRILFTDYEAGTKQLWQDETRNSLTLLTNAVRSALEAADYTASADGLPADQMRDKLSGRQLQVFDLLMRGLQTKEIARQLNLSPRTIEAHRAKILERLHLTSVSDLLKQLLARPNTVN